MPCRIIFFFLRIVVHCKVNYLSYLRVRHCEAAKPPRQSSIFLDCFVGLRPPRNDGIRAIIKNLLYSVVGIVFISLFSLNSLAQERLLDKVIAVVNTQVITQSEFDQQMKITRAQMQSGGLPLPSPDKLHQQVLNQLIDIALQKTVAKKANIVISEAEVDAAIAKIAAQNNVSVAELQQGVRGEGMSYSAYRQQIQDQLLIARVQQAMVAPKIRMTPQDIIDAKNSHTTQPVLRANPNTQYHVVDILVSSPEKADSLLSQLRKTQNPGKILNNNPAVKISDLGFRPLSELPDIFVKAVQSLSPGQFSNPVKAPNGIHIISLIAVKGRGGTREAPLTLEQRAYQKKFNDTSQKWLQTLRSQSYIKIIE